MPHVLIDDRACCSLVQSRCFRLSLAALVLSLKKLAIPRPRVLRSARWNNTSLNAIEQDGALCRYEDAAQADATPGSSVYACTGVKSSDRGTTQVVVPSCYHDLNLDIINNTRRAREQGHTHPGLLHLTHLMDTPTFHGILGPQTQPHCRSALVASSAFVLLGAHTLRRLRRAYEVPAVFFLGVSVGTGLDTLL